ncbi:MAG: hypothetical protein IPH13_19930 [Planctomycetes bacterium]|nr:hypothetical protein [Planctomycetota bacterium]
MSTRSAATSRRPWYSSTATAQPARSRLIRGLGRATGVERGEREQQRYGAVVRVVRRMGLCQSIDQRFVGPVLRRVARDDRGSVIAQRGRGQSDERGLVGPCVGERQQLEERAVETVTDQVRARQRVRGEGDLGRAEARGGVVRLVARLRHESVRERRIRVGVVEAQWLRPQRARGGTRLRRALRGAPRALTR